MIETGESEGWEVDSILFLVTYIVASGRLSIYIPTCTHTQGSQRPYVLVDCGKKTTSADFAPPLTFLQLVARNLGFEWEVEGLARGFEISNMENEHVSI